MSLCFSFCPVSLSYYLHIIVSFLAGSCDVNAGNRYECGWFGIDEETCLKRDCCWDESDPNAMFCFVRKYKRTRRFS